MESKKYICDLCKKEFDGNSIREVAKADKMVLGKVLTEIPKVDKYQINNVKISAFATANIKAENIKDEYYSERDVRIDICQNCMDKILEEKYGNNKMGVKEK